MTMQTLENEIYREFFCDLLILINLATKNTVTLEDTSAEQIHALCEYPFFVYVPLIKKNDITHIQTLLDMNEKETRNRLLNPWEPEDTYLWIRSFNSLVEMPWLSELGFLNNLFSNNGEVTSENKQKQNGISLANMLSQFINLQKTNPEPRRLHPIYVLINKAMVSVFNKQDDEIQAMLLELENIYIRNEQLTKENSYRLIAQFFLQPNVKKKVFQKTLESYCEQQKDIIKGLTRKDKKIILTELITHGVSYEASEDSYEYFLSDLCRYITIDSEYVNEFVELIHKKQEIENEIALLISE